MQGVGRGISLLAAGDSLAETAALEETDPGDASSECREGTNAKIWTRLTSPSERHIREREYLVC